MIHPAKPVKNWLTRTNEYPKGSMKKRYGVNAGEVAANLTRHKLIL